MNSALCTKKYQKKFCQKSWGKVKNIDKLEQQEIFLRGKHQFDNSQIVQAAKNMEDDYQELIKIALTL